MPVSRRPAAHTATSRSHATCCASPKMPNTATVWNGCFTTPFLDPGRWHLLLLLRLRDHGQESLVQRQMALLLGNISTTGVGLPYQYLSSFFRRGLREPVHSIESEME